MRRKKRNLASTPGDEVVVQEDVPAGMPHLHVVQHGTQVVAPHDVVATLAYLQVLGRVEGPLGVVYGGGLGWAWVGFFGLGILDWVGVGCMKVNGNEKGM